MSVTQQLHAALWRAPEDLAPLLERAIDTIERLRDAGGDILEWADHQSCAIDHDAECDCGFDALVDQWKEAVDG